MQAFIYGYACICWCIKKGRISATSSHPNVSSGHWALTTLPMMRMLSFAAVNAVLNHGTDDLDALFNAAHYWVIIIQGE